MKYYILFNGCKIYYSDSGQGETIVLLHGYLESSEIWNGFAKKLSGKFRVISIDLPGHGLSKVYGDCHTMEFLASAIKGLLDCLQIKKVFLVGHSLGGYITLAFLELYPDMLKGYCLFHSHPFADTPETVEKREKEIKIVKSGKRYLLYPENISKMYAAKNLEKFKEEVQRSEDIAATIRDEGIIAVLNGMIARPSRLSVIERGRVPCLWIFGELDNYISSETVRSKVRLPENARVVTLENSGHMGFVEEEELSVKIITEFITGLTT
jgi:pimeloyl-ACP methyl ester carboxylesterase